MNSYKYMQQEVNLYTEINNEKQDIQQINLNQLSFFDNFLVQQNSNNNNQENGLQIDITEYKLQKPVQQYQKIGSREVNLDNIAKSRIIYREQQKYIQKRQFFNKNNSNMRAFRSDDNPKKTSYVYLSYMFVNLGVYLLHKFRYISRQRLLNDFSVSSGGNNYFNSQQQNIFGKKIYTYLSHAICHMDFWHLIQNLNGIQNFAKPIEKQFGSKKLIQLIVWGALGSALAIKFQEKIRKNLRNQQNQQQQSKTYHFGASGVLLCLTFYYIMKYPKRKISFQSLYLPAWMAGILMLIQSFVLNFNNNNHDQQQSLTSHIGHIGGCFSGISFYFTEKILRAAYEAYIHREIKFSKPIIVDTKNLILELI